MQFVFQVSIEVERESGRFTSRADISAEIESALSDADPGSISIDESEYETVAWEIEDISQQAGISGTA